MLDQEVKLKEDEYEQKENSLNRLLKRLESAQRKLYRVSNVQQACRNAAERYFATETFEHAVLYPVRDEEIEELLAPTVKLHLHTMDIRELRSRFKDNQKQKLLPAPPFAVFPVHHDPVGSRTPAACNIWQARLSGTLRMPKRMCSLPI